MSTIRGKPSKTSFLVVKGTMKSFSFVHVSIMWFGKLCRHTTYYQITHHTLLLYSISPNIHMTSQTTKAQSTYQRKTADGPTSVAELKNVVQRNVQRLKRLSTLRSAKDAPDVNKTQCSRCHDTVFWNDSVKNQYDIVVEVPMLTEQRHNAMQLSDAVETFASRKPTYRTPLQNNSLKEFQNLLNGPSEGSLMHRLGATDGRTVSKTEYVYILRLLCGIFFPGTIPFSFDFCYDADAYGDCSSWQEGQTVLVRIHPLIVEELHDKPPQGSVVNDLAMSRFGALLHELCHAFLVVYACKKCPSYNAHVRNFAGHGFAWQRIAYSIELAAHRVLGLKFSMDRLHSITRNWESRQVLPSPEEMERWRLVDW